MGKIILIFLFPFLLVSCITINKCNAQAISKFDDKAYHYYVSGFLSSSGAYTMYQFNDRVGLCISIGALEGLGIGIGKETYDNYKANPTGFDFGDLAADCLGNFGGCLAFGITCDIIYRNKQERKIYKSVKRKNV